MHHQVIRTHHHHHLRRPLLGLSSHHIHLQRVVPAFDNNHQHLNHHNHHNVVSSVRSVWFKRSYRSTKLTKTHTNPRAVKRVKKVAMGRDTKDMWISGTMSFGEEEEVGVLTTDWTGSIMEFNHHWQHRPEEYLRARQHFLRARYALFQMALLSWPHIVRGYLPIKRLSCVCVCVWVCLIDGPRVVLCSITANIVILRRLTSIPFSVVQQKIIKKSTTATQKT